MEYAELGADLKVLKRTESRLRHRLTCKERHKLDGNDGAGDCLDQELIRTLDFLAPEEHARWERDGAQIIYGVVSLFGMGADGGGQTGPRITVGDTRQGVLGMVIVGTGD